MVLFHTHEVTRELVLEAAAKRKSMDLDICVDAAGRPYLGHSAEYHEVSATSPGRSMDLWDAVDLVACAGLPTIVDCKHHRAWHYVEEAVTRIGPSRCIVHTFAAELEFQFAPHSYDVRCEWSPAKRLSDLKDRFPSVSTTASAKGLPHDVLTSGVHEELLRRVKETLMAHQIDTVCLNVPDDSMSDYVLRFFLADNVIPHVMVDKTDVRRLSEVYIGETDDLDRASHGL